MGNTVICPLEHKEVIDPQLTVNDLKDNSKDTTEYFIPKSYADILMLSWNDCKEAGPQKIGAVTFIAIFAASSEAFEMFSFYHEANWENSHHFKHHCKVFVNVIGSAIETLHKKDLLLHRLSFLGYMHRMRMITQEQYDLTEECFLNALEKCLTELSPDKWTPEIKEAWTVLYKAMAYQLFKE